MTDTRNLVHFADFNAGYPEVICAQKQAPSFVCGWPGEGPVTCRQCLRIIAKRQGADDTQEERASRFRASWGIV